LSSEEDVFGLASQLRRAAVSVASSIVEVRARHSLSDKMRFFDMDSCYNREAEYQVSLTCPLKDLCEETYAFSRKTGAGTLKVLNGLLRAFGKA
jgi:four helix bundle protein